MSTVKAGDKIKVHYTGTLTDGTKFDSSVGREPLPFEVGAGMMIKGFDAAVVGMAIGESKTVNIPAAEAYGPENPEMIIDVPRTNLPPDLNPEVGQQLGMSQPNGQQVPVTIREVHEDKVVIDANHALAGKDLIFEIEIVEIA